MTTRKTTTEPLPHVTKRCGNPAETALRYGLGEEKLRKMRLFGEGPEFRVAGHRSIVYDWEKVEVWLDSLPKGGGERK